MAEAARLNLLSLDKFFQLTQCVARLFVYATVLALPFSHHYVHVFITAAIILSFITNDHRERFFSVLKQPSIVIGAGLVLLLILTMSYTVASPSDAGTWLTKYTKILYIPLIYPLFFEAKHRRQLVNALIVASVAMVALAALYWHHHYFFTGQNSRGFFINPIEASVLCAMASFMVLHRFSQGEMRWFNLVLFALIIYGLCFYNFERTGILITTVLAGYVCFNRYRFKGVLITLLTVFLMGVLTYSFSPNMRYRMTHAFTFTRKNPNYKYSSSGFRLMYYWNTLKIIKQSPWIGFGVGSFIKKYQQTGGPAFVRKGPLYEPHNSYLFMTAQAGIVGLGLFLWWLFAMWEDSYKLEPESKLLLRGVLIAFIINACVNVTIANEVAGGLYVIFCAALLAGLSSERVNHENRDHS